MPRPVPWPDPPRQDTPVGRFMRAREEANLLRAAAADAAAGPAVDSEAGFVFEDPAAARGAGGTPGAARS
jgi:hypothetical protein